MSYWNGNPLKRMTKTNLNLYFTSYDIFTNKENTIHHQNESRIERSLPFREQRNWDWDKLDSELSHHDFNNEQDGNHNLDSKSLIYALRMLVSLSLSFSNKCIFTIYFLFLLLSLFFVTSKIGVQSLKIWEFRIRFTIQNSKNLSSE